MKYFAKLNLYSKVIKITAVGDKDAPTEEKGKDYLNKLHNYPFWVECSKTTGYLRKNGAAVGMTYDEDRDAFISPKPVENPSWIFNEDTCQWEHPIPHPDDHEIYHWNEETVSWDPGFN